MTFSAELVEAVAQRVAELLREQDDRHARDLTYLQQQFAAQDAAVFISEVAPKARVFRDRFEILEFAISEAPVGFVAEFGVWSGETLRRIAHMRPGAHGFDSFAGLPEAWRSGYDAGAFAVPEIPQIDGVQLHVGWFSETLPGFLAENSEPAAFLHLDADIYSSTIEVLDACKDRIRAGTIILFDEYLSYPGWREHEHRAFMEFVEKNHVNFEYVAYGAWFEQVMVRILEP